MHIGLVVAPRFETFDVYRHLRSIEPRIDHAFVMRSQHRDAFAYFAYEGVGAVSSNSPVLSEHPNAAALWARYSNCHHAVGHLGVCVGCSYAENDDFCLQTQHFWDSPFPGTKPTGCLPVNM